MANFIPYQFTNLHYSPDYSQCGDGLFSPFGSQMFSQDLLPSTSQPYLDRAFEHRQSPIQPSPVPSAASGEAKKSNQREGWIQMNTVSHRCILSCDMWTYDVQKLIKSCSSNSELLLKEVIRNPVIIIMDLEP